MRERPDGPSPSGGPIAHRSCGWWSRRRSCVLQDREWWRSDVARKLHRAELVVLKHAASVFMKSTPEQEFADRLVARAFDKRCEEPRDACAFNRHAHAVQKSLFHSASQRAATEQQRIELDLTPVRTGRHENADSDEPVLAEPVVRADDEHLRDSSQRLDLGQAPPLEREVELVGLLRQL